MKYSVLLKKENSWKLCSFDVLLGSPGITQVGSKELAEKQLERMSKNFPDNIYAILEIE